MAHEAEIIETANAIDPLARALCAQHDLLQAGQLFRQALDVLGDTGELGLILPARANAQGVLCGRDTQRAVPLDVITDALLERAEALLALDHPGIRRPQARPAGLRHFERKNARG